MVKVKALSSSPSLSETTVLETVRSPTSGVLVTTLVSTSGSSLTLMTAVFSIVLVARASASSVTMTWKVTV